MKFYQCIYTSIFASLLLTVSACSSINKVYDNDLGKPFIYNETEFKRVTFNSSFKEPNSITICYNKYGVLPETLFEMANKECSKYNKSAEYIRQSFLICPIFTPIAVVFNCCSSANEVSKNINVSANSKSIICKARKR
jgi:hypothetical protein|tara:strand:- start:48 stop:461 length:414 start_codon:yes stop_codon:yes gene_type:complete